MLDEVIGPDGYRVTHHVDDGARLPAGAALLTVKAPTQGLLTAERTMLNLVCHLSGIATTTAAWVDTVEGTNATRCASAEASTTGWAWATPR